MAQAIDTERRGTSRMIDDRWSSRLPIILVPLIVLLFYVTASMHFGYTPDDTFIYLQFAKNVTHGNGIAFNAGEPTYGFTSPLWLFLIALGGKVGVDLYTAAKGIDLVFASLSIVAFYLLAFEMIRNVIVSLLATIAYSTHAWLLRWAGTGMETSLAVLLVLVAFVFVLRNEYFVATVFTALLTLVRPESFLLLGLIVIDVLVNSTNRSRAVQLGAGLLVMYAALILPWLIYAYSTFGTIVPNTALAKAGLALNIDNEASTFVDLAKTLAITDALAIVVLVIAGIALLRQGATTAHGQNGFEHMYFYTVRQSLMAIGWIVIVPIFYVMTDVNVISRYLLIVSPLIVVCAFFFLHRAMSASRQAKYSFVAAFLLTVGIMLQNQIVYRRYVVPHMQEFEQGMDMCLIPIGKWLNVNTSPDAKVFVQDIGAIGYYSDRTICDAAGLVSPTLLRLIRQGYTQREMMEKKIYKTDCHADYVVFRSPVAGKWQKDPGLFPVMTKPFIGLGLSNPQLQYYTVYKVK